MVARSAGSFLGGILNNPGAIIIGGLAIALLFFAPDIRKAFADFGKGFGKIELPTITLPEINFPEINFPQIKFPDFKLPDIFNGNGEPTSGFTQEPFEGFDPDEPRIISPCECGSTVKQDITGKVTTTCLPCDTPGPMQPIEEIFPDQPVSISDFINRFTKAAPQDFGVTVAPDLLDETQGFTGGGVSFEGGTIFETPIENLSLSQIINKFMVTASQAANIKAQAVGFTPEEQAFLNQGQEISPLGDIASMPAVSDPQFAGLTPEQIALRLTGGNISNF